MNNWNQNFLNPPYGQWLAPVQPLYPQPWWYGEASPYPPVRPRRSGVNLFLLFGALWLGGKAIANYQRALEAEQRLEAMSTYIPPSRPASSGPVSRTASVIPDFYDRPSTVQYARETSANVSRGDAGTDMTPVMPTPHGRFAGPDFGDGMFLVGVDIAPGTYRCPGVPGQSTFWARMRSASGETNDYIATFFAPGQCYVTVLAGEYFRSSLSGGWTRVRDIVE
jgi:hypothetical protein